MDGDGKPRLTIQLVFHCFDNVVRHKRFAVVLANVTMRIESRFAAEITGELAALIVFNQNHIFASPENGTDLGCMQRHRSEEHTSELQSHSFISYAVFCLKK